MYDHVGLKVANLDASARFYAAALAPLGHVAGARSASSASFGPSGAPALWLSPGGAGSGQGAHIAFTARDRASVDAFSRAGLDAGGRDNGGPGLRPDYSPTYYAAFLIDPDGNNVEAVCTR